MRNNKLFLALLLPFFLACGVYALEELPVTTSTPQATNVQNNPLPPSAPPAVSDKPNELPIPPKSSENIAPQPTPKAESATPNSAANAPTPALPTPPTATPVIANPSIGNILVDPNKVSNTVKSLPPEAKLISQQRVFNTNLMFSTAESGIIAKFFDAFDSIADVNKKTGENNPDDLNGLLNSLIKKPIQGIIEKPKEEVIPQPLPNLYIASIAYYSDAEWSIWLNGKKISSKLNKPTNEFFISKISRKEVELTWKPAYLLDMPTLWNKLSDSGNKPLKNIKLDPTAGILTLTMRPNQTFLPKYLAISEGLIKQGFKPIK
ncbi:MAG: hypothetical protein WCL30_06490 [Pseudomonadota bacterium]